MSVGLFAVGFINPVVLGGLGLAAVPIIIHLLSRRRYRRLDWGAMRFLLEADKKNRRRVRFEQLLLLLLRCAAMALLALLVARPFVEPGTLAAVLGTRGVVQRVIVLDDSASLQFRDGSDTQFTKMRAAAVRLVEWLHREAPSDPVSVYVSSKPNEPLASSNRLTDDRLNDLVGRMQRLECSHAPARPRQVFESIAGLLGTQPGGVRADVYILADFQRTDWIVDSEPGTRNTELRPQDSATTAAKTERGAQATAAGGRAEPNARPTGAAGGSVLDPLLSRSEFEVRAVLVGAGEIARDNVAVVSLQMERPQTIAGVPAIANATLANYGARPVRDLQLSANIDGAPLPVEPVAEIPPGGAKTVGIEVTFPEAGSRELQVGVGKVDHFAVDNDRRGAVPVTDSLRVLLVNGQPATDAAQDEVFLLANALAPQGQFSSGIRVETTDPAELVGVELNLFDCVFLCNVGGVSEAQAEALSRYVSAGGGLVFFLGDEIADPADYNRALWQDGRGLLPLPLVRITGPRDKPEGVGLVRTGAHPITSMFSADGDVLSDYVHFREWYECDQTPLGGEGVLDAEKERQPAGEPPPGTGSSEARNAPVVLARYRDQNDSPAVITKLFGRGTVVMFTSTADMAWNDWARSIDGSYVVTMLETVQHVARRAADPVEFTAGDRLAVTVTAETHELNATFKPPRFPNDPAVEVAFEQSGGVPAGAIILNGPAAAEPGTYRVEIPLRSGGVERRNVAVNVAAAESNLERAGAAEIAAMMGRIPFQYVAAPSDFLEGTEQSRRELWPLLVLLVAVLLFTEQGLAWWFGRLGLRRRSEERVTFAAGGADWASGSSDNVTVVREAARSRAANREPVGRLTGER